MARSTVFFKLLCFVALWSCSKEPVSRLTIDLSGLNVQFPVTISLSEAVYSPQGWNNVFHDHQVDGPIVVWPEKYKRKFISHFIVMDAKKQVIVMSEEFIYSNDELKANVTRKGKNRRVPILVITGGENTLYKNKHFLERPQFVIPDSLEGKIKNQPEKFVSNQRFGNQWRQYQKKLVSEIKKFPSCYYTLFRLVDLVGLIDNVTAEMSYSSLSPELKATSEGQYILKFIKTSLATKNGMPLPEITVFNANARQINLKNILKGKKYHFIDIWSSWCVPCRKQIPLILKSYQRVDTSKMEFISLSVDTDQKSWQLATKRADIRWPNYIQGPKENLYEKLAFNYIPQNMLTDSDGRILARNVTTNELDHFILRYRLNN
jgi:thiol-disulfide isomerase/thioredoxin